ncbi:MAG: hypothetical protein ACTSX6_00120 [Candidatus Heimdallarchaeaceae archaeon]
MGNVFFWSSKRNEGGKFIGFVLVASNPMYSPIPGRIGYAGQIYPMIVDNIELYSIEYLGEEGGTISDVDSGSEILFYIAGVSFSGRSFDAKLRVVEEDTGKVLFEYQYSLPVFYYAPTGEGTKKIHIVKNFKYKVPEKEVRLRFELYMAWLYAEVPFKLVSKGYITIKPKIIEKPPLVEVVPEEKEVPIEKPPLVEEVPVEVAPPKIETWLPLIIGGGILAAGLIYRMRKK